MENSISYGLQKKDNLMLLNFKFKTFSINLNAQHVNGMTPFDLALSTVIRYSRVLVFSVAKVFSISFILSASSKSRVCKNTAQKIASLRSHYIIQFWVCELLCSSSLMQHQDFLWLSNLLSTSKHFQNIFKAQKM